MLTLQDLHKAASYLHTFKTSVNTYRYTIGPSSKRVETRRNASEWVEIDHNPLQTHQTFNEIASQWVRNTRFLLLNVTQLAKERSEIFFGGLIVLFTISKILLIKYCSRPYLRNIMGRIVFCPPINLHLIFAILQFEIHIQFDELDF